MERDLKAFFYEYKYYLFPKDCETLAELKEKPFVCATRLKEEYCMAPDFVYESMAEETLEIEDPNRLFEVSVNLYSREEYDEILEKQVKLRCSNCERYEESHDKNGKLEMEGHHREMSLNGVCYEREGKGESWTFSVCAEFFWLKISRRRKELAACVDKNNQKKLNKILNGELKHFCFPVEFYGVKKDGEYRLYMSAGKKVSSLFAGIILFLSTVANADGGAMKEAGWTVFSFIPAGVKKVSLREKSYALYLAPAENPSKLAVRIQHPRAEKLSVNKKRKLISALNNYLNAELGEDVACSVTESYEIVNDRENTIPMSELKRKLQEKYDEEFISETGEKMPYPPLCTYGLTEEAMRETLEEVKGGETPWWLPYKNYVSGGMTSVPEMSFLEREGLDKGVPWWTMLMSYVYIYVPRSLDAPENAYETLMWYLSNGKLVPEPLRDPEDRRLSGMGIGFADCAEHGFIVENMIADEKKFFRLLRILAPVLRAYNAKAVVVNGNGVTTYACDYEFTPLEN